jgi:hypothetical protein
MTLRFRTNGEESVQSQVMRRSDVSREGVFRVRGVRSATQVEPVEWLKDNPDMQLRRRDAVRVSDGVDRYEGLKLYQIVITADPQRATA